MEGGAIEGHGWYRRSQKISDGELAGVTEGPGPEVLGRQPHWLWGGLDVPLLGSKTKLALESSRITSGHIKGHWGHDSSLAETQFTL